ncbi:MAG: hypothetical protein ACD_4C00196G0003 [uncultured bacterium (gcode 4)]|uniref:SpoVT-AbrB domain-containing protein n=1 Tax=uncultured bacterium (gcode 4) TaxID=1234023 RepID=K2F6I5_9BACT|nr:MAG: hypothetical protein ACD_4C00196G0003 [uncultured bacterium (gcode 4)]
MEDLECQILKEKWWIKMITTVTVWTKWQVVIPFEAREALNIKPGDTLMVVTKHDKAIWMVKTDDVWELMEYMRKEMWN